MTHAKNRIVAPKFTPPKFVEYGDDGLPHYIVAQAGQRHTYRPPVGFRLAVYFNGVELQHVTEADRKNGYVRTAHTMALAGGTFMHLRDPDGELMYRLYSGGVVRFVLVPHGPGPVTKAPVNVDIFTR